MLHRLTTAFFTALAHYSIAHPRRVILLGLAVTLGVAPGAMKLRLRTDGHALVDPAAPEVRFDQQVRARFGIQDPVVVLIEASHPDGIYNAGTLQLVRELTSEFMRMDGVDSNKVVSLATERGFRNRPATLHFMTLLENPRRTPGELAELRDDLRRIELYTGTIVSFDGKSTAIMIGAPEGVDRTALYQRVREVIGRVNSPEDRISVTGPPVAEALLGTHILEDLGVPTALLGTSTRSREDAPNPLRGFYGLRRFIARHVGLVPIAILIMALVFQFSFRRITASVLPMIEVGACLAFVFGLMGWCGVPVYLTIAVMPVLLTAMAVTDEIHIYSRYFALLHEHPGASQAELVRRTMDEMVCPVANAALTTAVGFISFSFSPLPPVKAFGIFTAIGLLFCLFWTLAVLPALFTLVPKKWVMTRRHVAAEGQVAVASRGDTRAKLPGARFGLFAAWAVRARWWIVGCLAVAVALAPLGLQRLVIQDSWIDGFAPESDFSRATRAVNAHYHGMHLLNVSLDAGETISGLVPATNVAYTKLAVPAGLVKEPAALVGQWLYLFAGESATAPSWRAGIETAAVRGGMLHITTQQRESNSVVWAELPRLTSMRYEIVSQPFLQQTTLAAVARFNAFIEQQRDCKVGKVLGPPDYVATTRFMVRPNDPTSRFVPSNSIEIKLMWDYYRIVRGPEALREAVDTNHAAGLTTVFLKEANFRDTARLMAAIRDYEQRELAPQNIRVGFAGDVAVSQSLIRGIVTTQLQSLLGSLAGIYLVTALLGRSLRWGLYAVIPCTLSVLFTFAGMGWLGIPLGVATSMFAAMTLGNGVDFAIHVLEGFTAARARGLNSDEALGAALTHTGPAVVINTLAIALGFGVLLLSQVPANARLGGLTILGLVTCLAASLFVLPVLLHWWPLRAPGPPAKTQAAP